MRERVWALNHRQVNDVEELQARGGGDAGRVSHLTEADGAVRLSAASTRAVPTGRGVTEVRHA